jgi:hypothetical protein
MDVRAEISYPEATTEQVYALVVDPEFRAKVCEDTLAITYDVDIDEHDDGGATVTVTRTIPAEVPDFVKKFVGETLELKQIEEWGMADPTGARTADVRLEIKGQPVTMTGAIYLETLVDGARQRFEADLKVAIPLLGKKIEPEVVKGILAGLRQEERTGRAWLDQA